MDSPRVCSRAQSLPRGGGGSHTLAQASEPFIKSVELSAGESVGEPTNWPVSWLNSQLPVAGMFVVSPDLQTSPLSPPRSPAPPTNLSFP